MRTQLPSLPIIAPLCLFFSISTLGAQTLAVNSAPTAPQAVITAQAMQASPTPAILAILPDDPAEMLGMSLVTAYEQLGAPSSVGALRGDEPWQDDVVFSYKSGYALSWFGDRLWQLRFSPGYAGSVYGLFLGDPVDKVYSLLGTPFYETEGTLVYRLPYRSYPVRLRVVILGGKVSDLYVYRADF